MTANPTRLCKGCGEVKDFVRGTWFWNARHGACGTLCRACKTTKMSKEEMARRAVDPEFRARRNEVMRVRQNAQYQNDAEWRERVKARTKAASRAWKVTNRHLVNAAYKKRYAAKKHRTPSWLTADDFWMMEQAYELAQLRNKATGLEWHVDHIVPLQGTEVSGLHVPSNLQVILASENLSKGAKWAIA